MITIYHLGVSQSDRIVWLMEELGLPYQLEWFDRLPSGLAPPDYHALHPVATAPTIRDGEVVLCESVAIIEYIIQRHGKGRLGVPPDSPHYPDYLYWMCFSTSLMSTFGQTKTCGPLREGEQETVYLQAAKRRMPRYLAHLDQRLGESPYLAGPEFTGVDIQNAFAVASMPRLGGFSIDGLRNVLAYVERITSRPAYIKAMALVGPDAKRPD